MARANDAACALVLGVTTTWLLVPAVAHVRHGGLAGLALVACAVSVATWAPRREAAERERWKTWDRLAARALFLAGLLRTPLSELAFPALVVAAYAASRRVGGLAAHLLFRYVGYLWMTRLLCAADRGAATRHTAAYLLHVVVLVVVSRCACENASYALCSLGSALLMLGLVARGPLEVD